MEKAPANRILNGLKRVFDRSLTAQENEGALGRTRAMLETENATLDDVVAAVLLDRLPEIQATLLEELETTRRVCAQQTQMMRLLETKNTLQAAQFAQALAAMKMMPETEGVGAALLDADEMAAVNYKAEISLQRVEAMNSGGDFSLFEDLVIERLGIAAGWQTQFCNATGVQRWQIQEYRKRDFVPPEIMVLAGNFVPVEPKPRISWTEEMYDHLSNLMIVAERDDDADLARRMFERFDIEIPVPCLTAAKNRLKRKLAEAKAAEEQRAAAANKTKQRLSRRAAEQAELEAERQRVREKAERVREERARALAEADAAWEASAAPQGETPYERWMRGVFT